MTQKQLRKAAIKTNNVKVVVDNLQRKKILPGGARVDRNTFRKLEQDVRRKKRKAEKVTDLLQAVG